jgi:hypothetical protein
MRPWSLRRKRVVLVIWLIAALFAAGNHYLAWGLFGDASRKALAIVIGVGMLVHMLFGPRLEQEAQAEAAARREGAEAAERARDKSNDAADAEKLRQAIGMPLDEK